MNKLLLLLLAIVFTGNIVAQPPEPPIGYRWVINTQLSDEFNGDELDMTKWYDYHPSWLGRKPAMFHPDMVSVKDGMLQIKNEKRLEDTVIHHSWNNDSTVYSINGGAVVSRTRSAFYGYYECRMKANKTLMSSTFWMSNGGADGRADCDDRYSLELDIQECVGRPHNAKSSFHNGMHSNTHYWYTNCEGAKLDHGVANQFDADVDVADTFHIYGAHWIDAKQVTFFLNNTQEETINFANDASDEPFDRPMQINMVTETYDWVGAPTDEELADNNKNTTYYDWIRSYKLLGIDEFEEEVDVVQNGGFETGDFTFWTGWGGNPREVVTTEVHSGTYAVHIKGGGAPEYVVNLKPNTQYTLSCYAKVVSGNINFGIKENGGTQAGIGATTVAANSGFEKQELTFTTNNNSSFKFYFYATGEGDEGYADDFIIKEANPSSNPTETYDLWVEGLDIIDSDDTFDDGIVSAIVQYKLNSNGKIIASMINADDQVIDTVIKNVYIGYAHNAYNFVFDSIPESGGSYSIKIELLNDEDELIESKTFSVSAPVSSVRKSEANLNDIVVYPNPSAEIIYVRSLDFNRKYEIKNLSGGTVLSSRLNAGQSIDLSPLNKGNYILFIKNLGSVRLVKF